MAIDIHNDPREKKTNIAIGKSIIRAGKARHEALEKKKGESKARKQALDIYHKTKAVKQLSTKERY